VSRLSLGGGEVRLRPSRVELREHSLEPVHGRGPRVDAPASRWSGLPQGRGTDPQPGRRVGHAERGSLGPPTTSRTNRPPRSAPGWVLANQAPGSGDDSPCARVLPHEKSPTHPQTNAVGSTQHLPLPVPPSPGPNGPTGQ
jgi:hypothetical protein